MAAPLGSAQKVPRAAWAPRTRATTAPAKPAPTRPVGMAPRPASMKRGMVAPAAAQEPPLPSWMKRERLGLTPVCQTTFGSAPGGMAPLTALAPSTFALMEQ